MADEQKGIRQRLSARGEEALGDLTQALLENPLLSQALQAAFGARERTVQAQRAAMQALDLPSAEDVKRLERRVRQLSARLDDLEDRLDDLE